MNHENKIIQKEKYLQSYTASTQKNIYFETQVEADFKLNSVTYQNE